MKKFFGGYAFVVPRGTKTGIAVIGNSIKGKLKNLLNLLIIFFMKKTIIGLVAFMFLAFNVAESVSAATLTVTLYGKGGLQTNPNGGIKVCPDKDQATCATATVNISTGEIKDIVLATTKGGEDLSNAQVISFDIVHIDYKTNTGIIENLVIKK